MIIRKKFKTHKPGSNKGECMNSKNMLETSLNK